MKKTLAIGLLFVLVFQLLGNYALFKIWQIQLKSQAKRLILQGLPQSQLTRLVLDAQTQTQLEWEDAREFRYQGNWYDVVRIETKGKLTYYDCYLDTQETKLIEKFSYLLDLEAFKQKNLPQNPKQIFKKILEEPAYMSLWQYHFAQVLGIGLYKYYSTQLSDNQIVINSPPPELFPLNN